MSWKSLVSAGLLCVLATPAFGAPQLDIISSNLNAQGNWVWTVRVAPTAAGEVLDVEAAFTKMVGGNILSVTNASPLIWDYNNPGNAPATHAWVKLNGTPSKPEGLQGNFEGAVAGTTVVNAATSPLPPSPPALAETGCEGTAANCAGLPSDTGTNQIFAALGSLGLTGAHLTETMIGTASLGTNFLTIVQSGPNLSMGGNSAAIQLSGAYDGGNASARVAETTGASGANYKNFNGTASRTLQGGDITLNGTTDGADFSAFGANWQQSVTGGWLSGDFDRDGDVDGADFSYFGANWQGTGGASYSPLSRVGIADLPGAGAGLEGGAVPEPASIALMGLAILGGLGLYGRKR